MKKLKIIIFLIFLFTAIEFVWSYENRYNWFWEEDESLDGIVSNISWDGRYLVVGTHDLTSSPQLRPNFGPGAYICLFDTRYNQPLWCYLLPELETRVGAVKISKNNYTIAGVSGFSEGAKLRVFDLEGTLLWDFNLPNINKDSVAIDASGEHIVCISYMKGGPYPGPTLFYFNRDSPDPEWFYTFNNKFAMAVDISDDGNIIAVANVEGRSRSPSIYIFNLTSLNPHQPLWHFIALDRPSNWTIMDLSDNGQYVALGMNDHILVFDTPAPTQGPKYPLWDFRVGGYCCTIHDLKLNYDGTLLAHSGPHLKQNEEIFPGKLELWDIQTGEKIWEYEHEFNVGSVDFSENGQFIVIGGTKTDEFNAKISLFSVDGPPPIWDYDALGYVSINGDGSFISAVQGVTIGWNVRYYEPVYLFNNIQNEPPNCSITYPVEGQVLQGSVTIRGTASDDDGSISFVQVGVYHTYFQAIDTSPEQNWTKWEYTLDLTNIPNGSLKIYAESVDNHYKYSDPAVVEVIVNNPNPAPTFTPFYTWTPSPLPTNTPTASPTPPQGGLIFNLFLNQTVFIGGDVLVLGAETINEGIERWVAQVVVLQVGDYFYFHPYWTEEFQYTLKYIPVAEHYREPLLAVSLPYDLKPAGPFYFFGALLDSDTFELLTDISSVAFIFM